ncbi:hypothetical protein CsatB_008535 [Cannabis sativa]|uniref:Uncharacterized protein n=1 Tax=Cannabis sativa TaxID=3483 RepID=A0A7J6FTP5_CANSA|nr:hypothetical protein F8388_019361 [Cannabis sativa]
MMKRVSVNSRQSQLQKDEAVINLRHQCLLQDYLELQKEFVSKKKKLKVVTETRDTLLAEVRFLRQRLTYLQNVQSPKITQTVENQNSHKLSAKKLKYNVNEAVQQHSHTSILDSNPISGLVENIVGGMEKETNFQDLKLKLLKKPKDWLINSQRV